LFTARTCSSIESTHTTGLPRETDDVAEMDLCFCEV